MRISLAGDLVFALATMACSRQETPKSSAPPQPDKLKSAEALAPKPVIPSNEFYSDARRFRVSFPEKVDLGSHDHSDSAAESQTFSIPAPSGIRMEGMVSAFADDKSTAAELCQEQLDLVRDGRLQEGRGSAGWEDLGPQKLRITLKTVKPEWYVISGFIGDKIF